MTYRGNELRWATRLRTVILHRAITYVEHWLSLSCAELPRMLDVLDVPLDIHNAQSTNVNSQQTQCSIFCSNDTTGLMPTRSSCRLVICWCESFEFAVVHFYQRGPDVDTVVRALKTDIVCVHTYKQKWCVLNKDSLWINLDRWLHSFGILETFL